MRTYKGSLRSCNQTMTLLSLLSAAEVAKGSDQQAVRGAVGEARKRTVEQQVALLDDLLVLGVLAVAPVCLDDAVDLVDRAVEPAGRDQSRQVAGSRVQELVSLRARARATERAALLVHELRADAKGSAHAVHRQRPVRLEQLGVSLDAHLADVVAGVRREDPRRKQERLLDVGCWHRKECTVRNQTP
jgi:hypothetical protein